MLTPAHHRSKLTEDKLLTETLDGIQSTDDRARSVWGNVLIIAECKKRIAADAGNKTTSKILGDKIQTCTRTIKENMAKLGADEACINETMTLIDNGDTDNVHINLLKLLVKRNPGMYGRKLAAYTSKVK